MKEKYSSNFLIGLLLGTLVMLLVWYWQKSTRAEDGALALLDRLKAAESRVRHLREEAAQHRSAPQSVSVPPTAVSPPPADDLTQVKGIGPVFAERLQAAGVRTIRAVAEMSAERLAQVLETTESRAENILAASQTHV